MIPQALKEYLKTDKDNQNTKTRKGNIWIKSQPKKKVLTISGSSREIKIYDLPIPAMYACVKIR